MAATNVSSRSRCPDPSPARPGGDRPGRRSSRPGEELDRIARNPVEKVGRVPKAFGQRTPRFEVVRAVRLLGEISSARFDELAAPYATAFSIITPTSVPVAKPAAYPSTCQTLPRCWMTLPTTRMKISAWKNPREAA